MDSRGRGGSFWPNANQIVPLAESSVYQNFVLANGVGGGMPPAIDVVADPPSDPVFIGPGGGFIPIDVTLTNNTNLSLTVNFWNGVVLPIGEEIGPQLGPFTQNIEPGATFNTSLNMEIPPRPPAATYTFNMKVGVFPDHILDVDSFTFIKTGAPTTGLEAGEEMAVFTPDMFDQKGRENSEQLTAELPEKFGLGQNYPNPFNPSTTIAYDLPEASQVKISLYDLRGRKITDLVSGVQSAGTHTVSWNGRDASGKQVASGVYLYRMEAGNFVESKKLILTK